MKEHSGSRKKYTEHDISNVLEFLVDNVFMIYGESFLTDIRHSNGYKLCPSPSRHISVIIRSGIHKSLL